ncbi:sensor histidine kinase [Ruicaihuangia caeni]|uniref:sensor histidine kinase n=1 Tax=Ruicaihuangia caeni TaxID=3042517 RepID=UPI0033902919
MTDRQTDAVEARVSVPPAPSPPESQAAPPGEAANSQLAVAGRPRFSRAPWSLRRRLMLGVIAMIAVLGLVVGVVSVLALRGLLMSQLDQQVALAQQRSERAIEAELSAPGNAAPGLGNAQSSGTIGLVVLDGVVVRAQYFDERAEVHTLTRSQLSALLGVEADGIPRTVELGGELGNYRVTQVELAPGLGLVVGLPQQQVDDAVRNLTLAIAAITAAALIVTALAGGMVVRAALRPLDRVAATAGRVAQLPLDRGEVELAERVALDDPRTELGRLGQAFNRMLDHVLAALAAREASERRVRQFVADASHELRTPLASIRGYAELTRRGADVLPDDTRHALARIESESVRMTGLVDELLLLARLDAGTELSRHPVDIGALLRDAVADAAAAAPDHEWSLDAPDQPVTVNADAARLQQAVGNLLANARLHTPAGTRVEVALSSHVPQMPDHGSSREVLITVTDDGPGIAPELQATLFERFVRGERSRTRANGGSTGLGLAIARAIAEAHGGSLTVESRLAEPSATEATDAAASGFTRFTLRLTAIA